MEAILGLFREAVAEENGHKLAQAITPVAPPDDAGRLYAFHRALNVHNIQADLRNEIIYKNSVRLARTETNAWIEVFTCYWRAIGELLAVDGAMNQGKRVDWKKVYEAWKELLNALQRGYTSNQFEAWTIPCLYTSGKYLRNFALKADEQARSVEGNVTYNQGLQDDVVSTLGKNENLQDAARQINRIFGLCLSDRSALEESRKWGVYYVTNLLFKIYFKLNSISLCKNLLRSIAVSSSDMPPLDAFPKAHQVTFNYYSGVLFFLEEDYKKAENFLNEAWSSCHKDARKNRELILTYLIPCRFVTSHKLPSPALLALYPRLECLFGTMVRSIKRADLAGFDAALSAGEPEFVKRRIYLTLERGRDIVLRNLLRKVFLVGGFDPLKEGQTEADAVRRTRIPVAEFAAAMRLSLGQNNGEVLDDDEVECMIANMIYKGSMKGYISRERRMVVLSKGASAFPGTSL
ncbi:COP9 signalosome complex subunit 12 [Tothia fuscella]|uniref:Protein CSN12 homolog n=1 Tax=Tothia fuscella TaxID=1048955 RepID=A0A9P4P2I2_9PEZI|nr:COP9 signalosome complex subunit 12 [Tothia fuscella]